MKAQVTAIIKNFENRRLEEAIALARIRELTGREVDAYALQNYWRGESIEDFVDRLCAEPIHDFERITDEDALGLIKEYLEILTPGRRDSIGDALDRRFGKPLGTLRDLVFQVGLCEPAAILQELKRDTRIYL